MTHMKKLLLMLLAVSLMLAPAVGVIAEPEDSEPVTLRVYAPVGGETPLTAGLQDDAVAREILEKTGVILDIELQDTNKTQAMVASGDLYDLNSIGNLEYVEPLIRTGAIAAMDDYLDYAPEIRDNFASLVSYSKDYLSAGTGGLYVLPSRAKAEGTPVYPSQDGNFLRWDYYQEIGAPEIDSIDTLIDVVAQIVENHPTTDDGKAVYGFSTFIDWGMNGYRANSSTRKYFGNDLIGSLDSFSLVDLSYRDLYSDMNDFWLCAQTLYKANQRGILDPESFNQKFENHAQKINEGRIMQIYFEWMVVSHNNDLNVSSGGTQYYVDIPFADTEEFPAWYTRSAPFGYTARMFVMSSKCEHPEKVMELLNWLYSVEGSRTIFSGVKGQTWDYTDGVPAMLPEALDALNSDSTYMSNMGMQKLMGLVGWDYDAKDADGYYVNLLQEPDVIKARMNAAEKSYTEYYGAEIPLDVIGNRDNQTMINLGYASLMPTEIPTSISRATTQVESYLMQEIPNLILSADDAAYDAKLEAIRADLKGLGYDDVRDFYKENFEKAVELYKQYE